MYAHVLSIKSVVYSFTRDRLHAFAASPSVHGEHCSSLRSDDSPGNQVQLKLQKWHVIFYSSLQRCRLRVPSPAAAGLGKRVFSAMGPWASFLLFLFLAFEVKIENFSHRWSKQNKNYRQVGVLKLTGDGVGKHGHGWSMPHQVLPRTVLSFSALKQPKIEVESPPWRAKSCGEPSPGKCSALRALLK